MESLELLPARVRIASILKKAILAGEYKSGVELSLTGIAEQLGVRVSRGREAFQTLASEGLITLRMNRGAIVNSIDEKFITDHYDMRILLEGEAAARAASFGMETSELLTCLYHLTDNLPHMDRSYYEKLNQNIHLSIWKAADNQKLYTYLTNLWNGPSIGNSNSELEHYKKSTDEHIQILLAIRKGDDESARLAMRQHISRSKDNILQCFRSAWHT